MNDQVFSKLKKLLEMSKRGSENEAEVALSKAQAIAAENNIDLALIAVQEDRIEPVQVTEQEVHHGKRFPVFHKYAAWIIQNHFSVNLVYCGSRYSGRYFYIFGDKKDIEFARYVYDFLLEDFDRRWKYTKLSNGWSTRYKQTWAWGCYQGLSSKLREARIIKEREKFESMPEEIRGAAENKYALVLSDKKRLINDYVGKKFPHLVNSHTKIVNRGGDAYSSGFDTGRTMNINRPLGGQLRLT